MARFEVFRCMNGARSGNVDFCGEIEAASQDDAEDVVNLMFGVNDNSHWDVSPPQETEKK